MKKAMAIAFFAMLAVSYVTSTAQEKRPTLLLAIIIGQNDEVEKYLEAGVDVNETFEWGDIRGMTFLNMAAAASNSEATRMLIEAGADVNQKTSDGATALHYAIQGGKTREDKVIIDVVRVFLDVGANVNEQTESEGLTPLMLAADYGKTGVVKVLMDRGADINAKDRNGRTALMAAQDNGHQDIVNLLKEAGAKE
jgi:ankyrin repeat protein